MQKQRSLWWLWLILGGLAFTAVLSLVIWLITRPRGDLVGEIKLSASGASPGFVVQAAPGDVVTFRWATIEIDASRTGGTSRQRERSMTDDLQASTVTIRTTPAIGAGATCPAFAGTNAGSSLSSTSYTLSGVNLECAIRIEAAGSYRFEPAVAWKPGFNVRSATLEVRREKH